MDRVRSRVGPILADGATYAGIVVLGHAVARLIAGPAREDQLSPRKPDTSNFSEQSPGK